MRGFPLINTIVVLAALILSGFGLVYLTSAKPLVSALESPKSEAKLLPAKIFLFTSESTGSCELMLSDQKLTLNELNATEFSADTFLDPSNAVIFLKAIRAEERDSRFFAKLVVEVTGKETLTHYFDASGDMDDFFELTF